MENSRKLAPTDYFIVGMSELLLKKKKTTKNQQNTEALRIAKCLELKDVKTRNVSQIFYEPVKTLSGIFYMFL